MTASPGGLQLVARKRPRTTTLSHRKHRFESFSQRIAKIKIDPVRQIRRHDIQDENLSTTASYFRTALEQLTELNLSENFSEFSYEVLPLSESLPQLVHFQDQILKLLVKYIEKRDALSLEPLLLLISHFAHDLGVTFERHYAKIVALVSSLASTHPDVEVIEWSFTCLAWLFKYLARLLVPDIRPTYDLLAPLLGKETQKPFVSKFAAEALSFLVRKTGIAYVKNREPLDSVVKHIFGDLRKLESDPNIESFKQGIMTLFSEAIKGINQEIHLSGSSLLDCLLEHAKGNSSAEDICCGVVINCIHHSNQNTFATLLNVVLDYVESHILHETEDLNIHQIRQASRLLYVVAGVRKGTRVENWNRLVDVSCSLLSRANSFVKSNSIPFQVLATVAVTAQYSPLEILTPRWNAISKELLGLRTVTQFLPFCAFFATLRGDRFRLLLYPVLIKYIAENWDSKEDDLCALLLRWKDTDNFKSIDLNIRHGPSFPKAWEVRIMESFHILSSEQGSLISGSSNCLSRCNAYLELMRSLTPSDAVSDSINKSIYNAIYSSWEIEDLQKQYDAFLRGSGLIRYIENTTDFGELYTNLWQWICTSPEESLRIPKCLEAILLYVSHSKSGLDLENRNFERFSRLIFQNIAGPSHTLRLNSLKIVDGLCYSKDHEHSALLKTAIQIEEIALNLENGRTISMLIRALASSYSKVASDPLLGHSIPAYCFGLLNFRFSQAWEDSTVALKQMAESEHGEAIITEIAFRLLLNGSAPSKKPTTREHLAGTRTTYLTEFQCSNLLQLDLEVEKTISNAENSRLFLDQVFLEGHSTINLLNESTRSISLRILNAIPQLAEKRSRILVPILLKWGSQSDMADTEMLSQESELKTDQLNSSSEQWTRKELKELLKLFSQFVNPKVLYKSDEVFACAMNLLSNGDVQIQKTALNILFNWKSKGILQYQENLLNLLDDARFRDEIAIFVQLDENTTPIQHDHREELVPVLLRLLYGKIVAKQGVAGGHQGVQTKRAMVLRALGGFSSKELKDFIDIALGPLRVITTDILLDKNELSNILGATPPRKQLGFLNMAEELIKSLGFKLQPLIDSFIVPILAILFQSSVLTAESQFGTEDDVAKPEGPSAISHSLRQIGFKCLNLLFTNSPEYNWSPYLNLIQNTLVQPRLDRLPIETAQSVSGLLHLLQTWSRFPALWIFFIMPDYSILEKLSACLEVPFAKDEVKLHVLETIQYLVVSSEASEKDPKMFQDGMVEIIIEPILDTLLVRINSILRGSPSKDLLEQGVSTLSRLSSFVKTSAEAKNLVESSIFLLNQPSRRISPKTKNGLLLVLKNFVGLLDEKDINEVFINLYDTITSLFGFFKDRASRELLSAVLTELSYAKIELGFVAQICTDVNSFSKQRIDEPDFDLRLRAFNIINEEKWQSIEPFSWKPIVYNALYFIKDNEELSIRTNASFTLRRFIQVSSVDNSNGTAAPFQNLLSHTLLPALWSGAREPSELVRSEIIGVLAEAIKMFPMWDAVKSLHSLLVEEDEEASFFNNILHIQQHRRLRALRRLAAIAGKGEIDSANIAHFFIPLIEHFIFDKADDDSASNLAGETIRTIGALTEWLEWSQYRALLKRYISSLRQKEGSEKLNIKLIGMVIDSLAKASAQKGNSIRSDGEITTTSDESDVALKTSLAFSIPSTEKLSSELERHFLPSLLEFLHEKDDSTVSLRIPTSISLVKLLRILPDDQFRSKLPGVLTDICHILRSKSQDARDLTRKTLAEISALLGPESFAFIIKELRGALLRGYQLHVLSFTVHSLLVATAPLFKPGDLDYCSAQLVAVIMDDTFGATGQEKDAEEYISKMKEVKSNKSYDSMELIAKIISVQHVPNLIRPVHALLKERLNLKIVHKIDEILRRIGVGLLRNESINNQDVLVLCFELIQDVYKGDQDDRGDKSVISAKYRRYLIKQKVTDKNGERGSTSSYNYKITRFSLDILRSVLHKHETLQTPANISGFVPIIGDALLQAQEEVQISALRLLTTIIRVPVPSIDRDAGVYLAQAIKFIKAASSTNSEIVQASQKLISAILRYRQQVPIKEIWIADLLKLMQPDLTQPDRQGVLFNFLKAVISRKIMIPEMYETADIIATIMITNQSRTARDLARGTYFQFLVEYPQSKERLAKQQVFLVKNLEYAHQEGRQSVLEAVHLMLTKFADNLVQEVIGTFFVPLTMVLINDESSQCREMAGALIKEIFERADPSHLNSLRSLIKVWVDQGSQVLLLRAALQSYNLYFEVLGDKSEPEGKLLRPRLLQILSESHNLDSDNWEILYFALQTLDKFCQLFPWEYMTSESKEMWRMVQDTLTFPHSWVKYAAAKIIGLFFADFARSNKDKLDQIPLVGAHGLTLDSQAMLYLTKASLRALNVPSIGEDLVVQVSRNLVFLGRCFGSNRLEWGLSERIEAADGKGVSGENESNDEEETEVPVAIKRSALQYLFQRLSAALRREPLTLRAPSLIPKTASLQIMATLCSTLEVAALVDSLPTILLPLHQLTDPAVVPSYSVDPGFVEANKNLTSTSQELIALLQKRLGTTEFINQLAKVREEVKQRREGRRVKRRIEAVAVPEKVGREKQRKGERKKERRKEKSEAERGKRRGW